MKHSVRAGILALFIICSPALGVFAQEEKELNPIDKTRTIIDEWVQTRQLISKEASDWRQQKEIITYKIDLLKTEIEALEAQILASEEDVSVAEAKRRELRAEEAELKKASSVVEGVVRKYENKILKLSNRFPEPLKDKVGTFLAQIPKEGGRTALTPTERIIIVLGILNEVDKFNGAVTVVSELREVEGGQQVQVKTMYLGLAQAYYVDGNQQHAAIGIPGADGWRWEKQSAETAADIARTIAMYENIIKPATFVNLPVTVE